MAFRSYFEANNFILTKIEDQSGEEQILGFLHQNSVRGWQVNRNLKSPIIMFDLNKTLYVIDDFINPQPKEAEQWVWDVSSHNQMHLYIDEVNYNKEFWQQVTPDTVLYHGTTLDGWQQIQLSGALEPKCKTRGISNRSVGCAVYMTWNHEEIVSNYEVVLTVAVGQMKSHGFTHTVDVEPEISEKQSVQQLANIIGLEEFNVDMESGMSPNTVVMFGKIPLKYLSH